MSLKTSNRKGKTQYSTIQTEKQVQVIKKNDITARKEAETCLKSN